VRFFLQRHWGRGVAAATGSRNPSKGEAPMPGDIRRYSVELKDVENDWMVLFTAAADWTQEEMEVVAQIMRLAGLPDSISSTGRAIEIKDVENDRTILVMAADWSQQETQIVGQVMYLAGLPDCATFVGRAQPGQ
jgi:hypothetical protein